MVPMFSISAQGATSRITCVLSSGRKPFSFHVLYPLLPTRVGYYDISAVRVARALVQHVSRLLCRCHVFALLFTTSPESYG